MRILKQRKTRPRKMSLKQFKNELFETARNEGIVSALEYGVMEVFGDSPKLAGFVLGAYSSLVGFKETVAVPVDEDKIVVKDNTYDNLYTEIEKEHLPSDSYFSGLEDELIFNFSPREQENFINFLSREPRKPDFSIGEGVISYMSQQLGWTEDKTKEELGRYGILNDKGDIDFSKLGEWFREAEILVNQIPPIKFNKRYDSCGGVIEDLEELSKGEGKSVIDHMKGLRGE